MFQIPITRTPLPRSLVPLRIAPFLISFYDRRKYFTLHTETGTKNTRSHTSITDSLTVS